MTTNLKAFKHLVTAAPDSFKLTGDLLLVEKIDQKTEKKIGNVSIEIVSDSKQIKNDTESKKPTFVRVLAVGEGYDDVDDEGSGMYVQPGDVILVGKVSVSYFSTFGDLENYEQETIGLTRQAEVQLHFPGGDEGYRRFFEVLNSAPGQEEGDRSLGSNTA